MARMPAVLIRILACPACKQRMQLRRQFLVCAACGKAYPVLGSVPDMLIEDAWPLAKARAAKFAHRLKLTPARRAARR